MVIHPIIFGLFPVVVLYSHNIRSVEIYQLLLPSGVILAATLGIWGLLIKVTRHRQKAALMTSLSLFLFFSYGHIFELFHGLVSTENSLWIDRIVLPIWMMLLLAGLIALYRTQAKLIQATKIVTVFASVLLLISLAKIGLYVVKNFSLKAPYIVQSISVPDTPVENCPDVYYIVLDAYARSDILREFYDYDNSPFLDPLKERGFYIADQSRSNYSQTCLSLSATLNLSHHDTLAKRQGVGSNNVRPLTRLLHQNRVMEAFKHLGYEITTFATGYVPTQIRRGTRLLSPLLALDDAQNEIFNATPIPVIQQAFSLPSGRRRRTLYTFDRIAEATHRPGPQFVFAHIMAPHEPFIFGPKGEMRRLNGRDRHSAGFDDKANYVAGYRDQLVFINKKVLETIDAILTNSKQPPIIIIQSDHGPASQLDWENPTDDALRERMSILNALHLPDIDPAKLRPDFTPINTFGLIMNHYFKSTLEPQSDISRFSSKATPYNFTLFHP